MNNGFTDKDKDRVVDFLNFVSNHATFDIKTPEIIKYFQLLSFMQKELLPKINNHVLEIKSIKEVENKEE